MKEAVQKFHIRGLIISSICDHSRKKEREREREGQIEGRVCVCVEPSHILFLQAAVCQRQGKKNKKIRTVKLPSEKKSWKSCVKIWNGMHFVCW